MSQWATLKQSTHQALISKRHRLAEAWPCETVTPTHDRDRVVYEILKVEIVSLLIRVSMNMDDVEPAIFGSLEGLQIIRTDNTCIFFWSEVLIGSPHTGEEDTTRARVDSRCHQIV